MSRRNRRGWKGMMNRKLSERGDNGGRILGRANGRGSSGGMEKRETGDKKE